MARIAISNRTELPDFYRQEKILDSVLIEAADWAVSGTGSSEIKTHATLGFDYIEVTIASEAANVNLDYIATLPGVKAPIGYWVAWLDAPQKNGSFDVHMASSWSAVRHSRIQNHTQNTYALVDDEWRFLCYPLVSAFSTIGGDVWTLPRDQIRLSLRCAAGQTNQRMAIGPMYYNLRTRPKVVLGFDDTNDTDKTEAYDYMQPLGLLGTSYVMSGTVGGLNDLTLAQMQTMYDAGWDFGIHGSGPWVGQSVAENQAYFEQEMDYLEANGFSRAKKHCSYPGGAYDVNVYTALKAVNMKTARNTITYTFCPAVSPNLFEMFAVALSNSATPTAADALVRVDEAIAEGSTLFTYIHRINDAASGNWAQAEFRSFIDSIVERKNKGLIDVMTISQWYDGLSGDRVAA